MYYQSYLNSATKILQLYQGDEPFAGWLKKYFSENKKYGSKDRKHITAICYAYFRLGKSVTGITDENLLTGLFLSEQFFNEIIHNFKPDWDECIGKPVADKVEFLKFPFKKIFPFEKELTAAVSHSGYCQSFLMQPKLFIRVRPHKKNIVIEKLQKAKIPLAVLDEDCIALSNATSLDEIITTDKEAVIQDYNSQQVFNFLKTFLFGNKIVKAWDCCAASGGKSILLYDIFKKQVELTVSDIRLTILLNLHHRFTKAGIKNYNYFIEDLSKENFHFPDVSTKGTEMAPALNTYQLIICDVPCTGSGTWSRTPENLYYFKPEIIEEYTGRQKQIVTNVIPFLQQNGLLVYITCSVFKKENEDVAQYIKETFQLQLLHMELLKGYDKKADSMFVAVFSK